MRYQHSPAMLVRLGGTPSFQCLDWIDRNDLDTSETLTVLGLGHQMPSI